MSEIKNLYPELKQNFTKTSSGSEVCSYTSDLGPDTPIVTLIHGYPQSAYHVAGTVELMHECWLTTDGASKQLIPILKQRVSLFVPELPGYGVSTATQDHSKRGVGSALLEALQKVFNISEQNSRKVVLGGHDRGARICHRLTVDRARYPSLHVLGTILLDIVPTKAQWDAMSDPLVAAGYFHWPLMANAEIGFAMIKAYGGAKWCRDACMRIGGAQASQQRIIADGAVDQYASLFARDDVIRYSIEDYAAGARVDVDEQIEDQKAGRKIDVPTLVMFSKAKLGARQDVEAVWKDWIKEGVPYEVIGVGDGHGHYLPEEATDTVAQAMIKFLDQYT